MPKIHIHNALVNTEGVHCAAVGTRQNAHRIFHAQRHD